MTSLNFCFSKSAPVSIIIVVDDYTMTKSDFETWSHSIYLDSKLPINSFKIYSHSIKNEMFPDTWVTKNKTAHFYPSKIDCDYSACTVLGAMINEYKTEKTKLFVGEGEFTCNLRSFGVENGYCSNTKESILTKIGEEVLANKSASKILTLIFYIPSEKAMIKPSVSFQTKDLEIKKGESVILNVTASANSTIIWDPTESLSCTDCLSPSVKPVIKTTYSVKCKNNFGCESETARVSVNVIKACDDNFQSASIDFYSDSHLYQQPLSDKSKWLVASTQPGSEIYYLVCNKNCADNLTVEIYDLEHHKIWFQDFKRTDVEAGNKLHEDHPENFIFKINMNRLNDLDKDKFYTFEIKSKNDDKDTFKTFVSPLCRFVECGL